MTGYEHHPQTNVDFAWCDWCGDEISATPCPFDERVFCGLACVAAYRASYKKPDATQQPAATPSEPESTHRMQADVDRIIARWHADHDTTKTEFDDDSDDLDVYDDWAEPEQEPPAST